MPHVKVTIGNPVKEPQTLADVSPGIIIEGREPNGDRSFFWKDSKGDVISFTRHSPIPYSTDDRSGDIRVLQIIGGPVRFSVVESEP